MPMGVNIPRFEDYYTIPETVNGCIRLGAIFFFPILIMIAHWDFTMDGSLITIIAGIVLYASLKRRGDILSDAKEQYCQDLDGFKETHILSAIQSDHYTKRNKQILTEYIKHRYFG